MQSVALFYINFISYQIFFASSLTTNSVFIIFYCSHFLMSLGVYHIVKKGNEVAGIKLAMNMPLWCAIFFLVQQPAIEIYATIAYGARILGGLCVVLFLLIQFSQLEKTTPLKTLAAIIVGCLAFSLYEVNIFFLTLGFGLPFLANRNSKESFLETIHHMWQLWKDYYVSLVISIIGAGIYFLLTFVSLLSLKSVHVEQPLYYIDIIKRLLFYGAQNILPNSHGAIFYGSVIVTISFAGLFIMVMKSFSNVSKQIRNITLLVLSIIILFNIILSFLPYFAPRLMHTYTILVAILLGIIINELKVIHMKKEHFKNIIDTLKYGLIIASIINIFHYFSLQDTAFTALNQSNQIIKTAINNNECVSINIEAKSPQPVRLYNPMAEKDITFFFKYIYGSTEFCHQIAIRNNFPILTTTSQAKKLIESKLFNAINQSPYQVSFDQI